MILPKSLPFLFYLSLTSCATPYDTREAQYNDLRHVIYNISSMNERIAWIKGIALINKRSTNLISSRNIDSQKCMGLLLTEDKYKKYLFFNNKMVVVRGIIKENWCSGDTYCHNSCSNHAIEVDSINLLPGLQ